MVQTVVFLALLVVVGAAYWTGRRDRPQPRRTFTVRRPVSAQGDGWTDPDNGGSDDAWDDDAEARREPLPKPAPKPEQFRGASFVYDRFFGHHVRVENDCPKCRARNAERKKGGLEPLPGYTYSRRNRDGSLWCRRCDQFYTPIPEEAAASVLLPDPITKAA